VLPGSRGRQRMICLGFIAWAQVHGAGTTDDMMDDMMDGRKRLET